MSEAYPLLKEVHYFISRGALIAGLIALAVAVYIGLIRHGDVTRTFRFAVYGMVGVMVLESLLGLGLYSAGGRPYQEVHLIYGMGAVLALPFFIFVETTAKKRPAMGSYIWGFALMSAIIVRSIITGASG